MSTGKNDPELRQLLERARKSQARKQHLVPKFYLKNWADHRGLVRVTDKSLGVDYLKKPEKVGRITDFYTLESENISGDPPPLLAETIYAEVESQAAPVIRDLISGPRDLSPAEIVAMTLFLGFQLTRGRTTREEHSDTATNLFKLQFGGLDDEAIRRYFGGEGGEPLGDEDLKTARQAIDDLMAGKIRIGPEKEGSIGLAMKSATEVGALLALRAWIVSASRTPIITSDEPVVLLGSSDRPRSQRSGLITAEVIVFPLSTYRVLVMLDPLLALQGDYAPLIRSGGIYKDELSLVESIQLSRELAMNCHRWVFETPSTRIGKNIYVPDSSPRMATEWVRVTDRNGETADVQRSYGVTRWAEVPRSMWPRGRLWPLSYPPPYPPARHYGYRGLFDEDYERDVHESN